VIRKNPEVIGTPPGEAPERDPEAVGWNEIPLSPEQETASFTCGVFNRRDRHPATDDYRVDVDEAICALVEEHRGSLRPLNGGSIEEHTPVGWGPTISLSQGSVPSSSSE